tara:strand:- start:3701 stop:4300 length:600 start_codon:yes stop_codon:yes gene_type:complete
MTALILALTTVLVSGLQPGKDCEENAYAYENIVEIAANHCKYAKSENINIDLLWSLVAIEDKYNVPYKLRGMILAAACMESGYNPLAKGDRKFSKDGKTPKAIGILQQWPMYERAYGTVRTDPVSAADGWMKHIVSKLGKVRKQCRFTNEVRRWIGAWVTGIRYPKKGGRCLEVPNHLRLLNDWHDKAKKLFCEPPTGC